MKRIRLAMFILVLSVLSLLILVNVHASTPPPDFKVAFIGDQGLTDDSKEVLRLIRDEGAERYCIKGTLIMILLKKPSF